MARTSNPATVAVPASAWARVVRILTVVDFPAAADAGLGQGDRVDAIHFLLPRGAELVIDDLVLYEPGR